MSCICFHLHKKLRQVLRLSVCNVPFMVFNSIDRCLFSFATFASSVFSSILCNLVSIIIKLLLFLLSLSRFFEFLFIIFFKINGLILVDELKTNGSSNFPDVLLNSLQLVHIPEFKLVIFSRELACITKAFKKHKFLVCSFLHDGMSDQ